MSISPENENAKHRITKQQNLLIDEMELTILSQNQTYDYNWNVSMATVDTTTEFPEEYISDESPITVDKDVATTTEKYSSATDSVIDYNDADEEGEIPLSEALTSSSRFFFEPVLSPDTWHFMCISYDDINKSVSVYSISS